MPAIGRAVSLLLENKTAFSPNMIDLQTNDDFPRHENASLQYTIYTIYTIEVQYTLGQYSRAAFHVCFDIYHTVYQVLRT
jgi:hypothetical protein